MTDAPALGALRSQDSQQLFCKLDSEVVNRCSVHERRQYFTARRLVARRLPSRDALTCAAVPGQEVRPGCWRSGGDVTMLPLVLQLLLRTFLLS